MKSNVTIRMDNDLKRQAERLFAEMGMNITTAFTVFAKAVVRQGKIPFEVAAADPFWSEENQAWLEKARQELEEGKWQMHELIEVGDDE